jgi:hypothetical protein
LWACWCCQDRSLRARPWQWCTPGRIDDLEASLQADPDSLSGERGAAELLRKMLANGVSKFSPDPIRELEVAENA